VHFGIILGWSVLAAFALWFVARSFAGDGAEQSVACDLYSCYCVLGYCLLPMEKPCAGRCRAAPNPSTGCDGSPSI